MLGANVSLAWPLQLGGSHDDNSWVLGFRQHGGAALSVPGEGTFPVPAGGLECVWGERHWLAEPSTCWRVGLFGEDSSFLYPEHCCVMDVSGARLLSSRSGFFLAFRVLPFLFCAFLVCASVRCCVHAWRQPSGAPASRRWYLITGRRGGQRSA